MIRSLKPLLFLLYLFPFMEMQAQKQLSTLARDPALKGALVSAIFTDIATGEVLSELNPDQRLCPASVWKLFTTTAALDRLGVDFQFRTVLAYDGKLEGGVLNGNIFIIGGGDPSLGSRYFAPDFDLLITKWAVAISKAGIDTIHGKIIANAAHFTGDGMPRTRIWEDMANYYGTAASGLNINDNTYFVDFKTPSTPGQIAEIIGIQPEVPGLIIESEVESSTLQSDQAFIFGSPFDNVRMVRGTLPAGRAHYEIKGSLPDPALFAAYHLQKSLVAAGLTVNGGISVERAAFREPSTLKVIAEYLSPPLSELTKHINVRSDNLFAESLLMQIGAKEGNPSVQGGLDALDTYFRDICQKGYPFYSYDGSGLSRFTAVSASQVVQVLHHCHGKASLKKFLLEELPLAGKEGSMRSFGRSTAIENNLRGKSGSMEKVRAYAGYFKAASGREIAFAFIVNNFDGDGVQMKRMIEQELLKVFGDW